MRSLFLRIFLSFWLATALFVVMVILLTVALRPERQVSAVEAQQSRFLADAVDAYQSGGSDKLHDYLRHLRDTQHVRGFLVSDQGSPMGHPVPPWIAEVADGRRRTADSALSRLLPHPQFLRSSMTGPDGRRYTLVLELPPGNPTVFGPHGVPSLGILIAVLSSGLVCYFLARYLSSPIVELRTAAQRLAAGDLSARVKGRSSEGGDEISQLVYDFNHMAERIESLVAAQSRLLKDISHELRSPLARLAVALELARQRSGSDAHSALDRINLESDRMTALIGSLTTIARLESGAENARKIPVELEELVQEVARDAAFEAQTRTSQVECEILDELPVHGDPALLHSALENVVRNATRYTPGGTTVKIRAERSGNEAVVLVTDCGPGVPHHELQKIFRPFYRIDDSRVRNTGGVGLGLAITEQAVKIHGGTVAASNLPEGGLKIEIRIPLRSPLPEDKPTAPMPVAQP
jgi:two-component system sensor histidine kinase CpxA